MRAMQIVVETLHARMDHVLIAGALVIPVPEAATAAPIYLASRTSAVHVKTRVVIVLTIMTAVDLSTVMKAHVLHVSVPTKAVVLTWTVALVTVPEMSADVNLDFARRLVSVVAPIRTAVLGNV